METDVRQKPISDDFPTPPWATRALLTHVIKVDSSETVLAPAAGRGYLSEVLKETFADVVSYDIADYGYCPVLPGGFLESFEFGSGSFDWVIAAPLFPQVAAFAHEGLRVARRGVALLCRTMIVEGADRFENLYSVAPPSVIAQFVERVPIIQGRVDPKASTATAFAWLVWDRQIPALTRAERYPSPDPNSVQIRLWWIPPCRRELEREQDYILPAKRA
jgi:hypothetical protein